MRLKITTHRSGRATYTQSEGTVFSVASFSKVSRKACPKRGKMSFASMSRYLPQRLIHCVHPNYLHIVALSRTRSQIKSLEGAGSGTSGLMCSAIKRYVHHRRLRILLVCHANCELFRPSGLWDVLVGRVQAKRAS